MKLDKDDEKILINLGCTSQDIEQIKRLQYKFTLCYKNGKEQKISIENAKQKLTKEQFLSGIERAAFHSTSFRNIEDSEYDGIFIKSNLFNC